MLASVKPDSPLATTNRFAALRLQLMASEQAERLGKNIRRARLAAGLNQRELADKLGPATSNQHVSNWERAVNKPSERNLGRIAEALSKPIAWFYEDHEQPATPTPDLMAALANGGQSQLDRVEEKLDAILEHFGISLLADPGEEFERELEAADAPSVRPAGSNATGVPARRRANRGR